MRKFFTIGTFSAEGNLCMRDGNRIIVDANVCRVSGWQLIQQSKNMLFFTFSALIGCQPEKLFFSAFFF